MHFVQVLVRDVGVNLSRADAAVAQHCLNTAYVSAIHQEVRSKAMAHGVRTDVFCDAAEACIMIDDALYAAGAETPIVAAVCGYVIAAIADK